MRSDAKAATAGSTQRQAGRLGRIFRGVGTGQGAWLGVQGGGASKGRRAALSLALLVAAFSLALGAGSASAVAPTIVSTGASAVTSDTALLEAEINPEGEATTYHFEYGTADCSSDPCTSIPIPNANAGSGSSAVKVTRQVEGLSPQTTYHFRVVATNGSGPSAGPDRTFTTYAAPLPNTDCPNQIFRTGPAANLPNCRAYEMVSPLDKNGGDIATTEVTGGGTRGAFNQSSLDGAKLTFSASTSFAGSPGNRAINQYIATRGNSGWTTQSIDAPLNHTIYEGGGDFVRTLTWQNMFRLFTPDLSTAWLTDQNATPLTPDANVGVVNLYRRDSLGGYQALTTGTAENVYSDYFPELQGHSADFSHVVFAGAAKLTPDAAAITDRQVYDYSGGELHLVSVRPNGAPSPGNLGWDSGEWGLQSTEDHSVSDDGSRLFWTAGASPYQNGPIYLRENPAQPQSARAHGIAGGSGNTTAGSNEVTGVITSSGAFAVGQTIAAFGIPHGTTIVAVGASTLTLSAAATVGIGGLSLEAFSECTEPAKACTIPVSIGSDATYWAASADGSKAVYSEGELEGAHATLYEFDLATETSTPIAGEVYGVLGAGDDASRIYFNSGEVLDAGATAGQPNLYLSHNGTISFIGTLAPSDSAASVPGDYGFSRSIPSVDSPLSLEHASRISADGSIVVFGSASPSLAASVGYDNADALNGKPSMEVYLYDASADGGEGRLSCVSCNPSGARPVGQVLRLSYRPVALQDNPGYQSKFWAAAWIQAVIHPMYPSRLLSEDGNRLYFNSFDALVPQDSNGAQDVYQWEAPGSGDCTEASPSFSALNDGCISLISSGASTERSEFVDATPDGSSVFFETSSSLDPRDPGLIDIYVARVNGGFPLPPPPPSCEGDGCQNPPPPPSDPTPASASFRGAGDPAPRKARRNCKARNRNAAKGHKSQAKHKKAKKRCRGGKRGAGR